MSDKLKEEPIEMAEDMEVIAIIKFTNILWDLALIKKYAIEKNDEKIYLCADNIEKDLHKVIYGNAKLEKGWF